MSAPALQIGKCFRLLGSDRDAEVIAPARTLDRTPRQLDRDWHWLAQREFTRHHRGDQRPEWQALASEYLRHAGYSRLSPAERDFLTSMTHWPTEPSDRQWAWLNAIAEATGARRTV